jgi:Flp pilus assembly protein TadD
MGDGKEALAHLRKAVELRPDDPSGQNNLGVALAEQSVFAEAIPCYEQLLAKHPDYVLAWNNYGNALRSSGQLQAA